MKTVTDSLEFFLSFKLLSNKYCIKCIFLFFPLDISHHITTVRATQAQASKSRAGDCGWRAHPGNRVWSGNFQTRFKLIIHDVTALVN